MPSTSIRRPEPETRGRRRKTSAATTATAPSGTFIQNTHRQPGPSVNHPPSNGPATDDRAKTLLMMPRYFPR